MAELRETIQALRAKGMTFSQIGQEVGLSDRSVRRRFHGAETVTNDEDEDTHEFTMRAPPGTTIKTVEQLMDLLGIDPTLFQLDSVTTGSWQVKCAGEPTETLFKVAARVQPVPIVSEGGLGLDKPEPVEEEPPTGPLQCLVAIPDTQHGFRDGVPLHDDDFLDSVLRVIEHIQQSGQLAHVMLCGDHLDLAPWSTKYRVTPDLRQTTNASFKALYTFLERLKRTAKCPIDWFEGNHEKRILDFLAERAPEAWAMKDPVTGKRVFSIENLLHLEELGIQYVAPYGTRKWYFDNKLYGYHGTKHGGRLGQVFEQHLSEGAASAIFGHVHQQGIVKKTLDLPGRPELFAGSPGCGCSTEGLVPAGSETPQSWQKGLLIVWYDGKRLYPELLSYQDKSIVWAGRKF